MDTLPPELLTRISTYLPPSSILPYRLTSRVHAGAALRTQFHTIPLTFLRTSFANLLFISRHPIYSKLVVRIDYGPYIITKPARKEYDAESEEERYDGEGLERRSCTVPLFQPLQPHYKLQANYLSIHKTSPMPPSTQIMPP